MVPTAFVPLRTPVTLSTWVTWVRMVTSTPAGLMALSRIPTAFRSPDANDYGDSAYYMESDGRVGYNRWSITDSYGNCGYNASFRNTYSTNPIKIITAKLITGGFALRTSVTTTVHIGWLHLVMSATTSAALRFFPTVYKSLRIMHMN